MTLLALPEVTDTTSSQDHFNNIQQALCGDLLPRDSSGDAADLEGDLGTEAYPWLKMHVKTGHLAHGFIVPFYDYNGLLPIPHGYMVCNGDTITRENYNIQHRTGVNDTTDYWATYVIASELENLYLPNTDEKFLSGTASSSADGTAPHGQVGATDSLINLQHNHGGATQTSSTGNTNWGYGGTKPITKSSAGSHYHSVTVPNDLTTVDVTPVSIDVLYLMRIVE